MTSHYILHRIFNLHSNSRKNLASLAWFQYDLLIIRQWLTSLLDQPPFMSTYPCRLPCTQGLACDARKCLERPSPWQAPTTAGRRWCPKWVVSFVVSADWTDAPRRRSARLPESPAEAWSCCPASCQKTRPTINTHRTATFRYVGSVTITT